ncbi:MAG: hypothetical protein IJD02_01535 [Lachnospiraceae bacterium]|nr:hypothetical protein [Lachnospiraceae bacterium]
MSYVYETSPFVTIVLTLLLLPEYLTEKYPSEAFEISTVTVLSGLVNIVLPGEVTLLIVGIFTGALVGGFVGVLVGALVGTLVVGVIVGVLVGTLVLGASVGTLVGTLVTGVVVGFLVGTKVGESVGLVTVSLVAVGVTIGDLVGFMVGSLEASLVGKRVSVGLFVGIVVTGALEDEGILPIGKLTLVQPLKKKHTNKHIIEYLNIDLIFFAFISTPPSITYYRKMLLYVGLSRYNSTMYSL